jgi:caffeoyl-CoA O-methyltransferase
MFHNIPEPILKCMRELEAQDAIDREDGTPRGQRLRQIPPVTGKFLALLCASAPKGGVLEVGTSGGYSSLWLSLACRERGDRLTTFEILEEKVARANETFEAAGVSGKSNSFMATRVMSSPGTLMWPSASWMPKKMFTWMYTKK